MIILVKYLGEIKVNQVGINFEFPHYSTVLGSILAVYHKKMNTPRYPRIDMLDLSKELSIELSLMTPIENQNNLTLEYTQLRNMESKIKTLDDQLYSPAHKFIIKGNYYILIKTDNPDLIDSLIKYSIKIGSNESTLISYEIEVFNEIEEFVVKYNNKLMYLDSSHDYTYEASFNTNEIEICLVSQLQRNNHKLFAQGIYSKMEWKELDIDFPFELINYKRVSESNEDKLVAYVNKINGV